MPPLALLMPATPEAVPLVVTPSTPSEPALVPVLVPLIAAPVVLVAPRNAALTIPAVMVLAAKLPVLSRLTMALAVSVLVGATFHFKFQIPLLVTGVPLTAKSELGALSPT